MSYDPLSRLHLAPPERPAKPRLTRLNPRDHDVPSLRRLAWQHQGVAMLPVDDIEDELVRRIVEALATEMYGPRR